MKKERNSNIELLRIISMFLIVLSHYTVHNGINNYGLPIGINRFILEISALGNIGTITFILISGYFLIQAKNIKLEKILKLIIQIVFYSIIIYIMLVLLNKKEFSIIDFVKNCLPITFKRYWFASVYFILYMFTPFINKFLNNLSKNEYSKFIIINLIIFSILNTFTGQDYYGNELIQFIIFYSIGGYISKYPNNKINDNSTKLFFLSIIVLIISVIGLDLLGKPFSNHSTYFLKRTSFLTILVSTSMLCIFSKKKRFNNNVINKISSCTFAIYLISDNPHIRPILWNEIFQNQKYVLSKYLMIHMVLAILSIMIVCTAIELIRKALIEKPLFRIFKEKIEFIEKKVNMLIP